MCQSQELTFWGISKKLLNPIAELKSLSYKSAEIKFLMEKYELSTHLVSIKIYSLLNAVLSFRVATDLKYVQIRHERNSFDKLKLIFDEMGAALNYAINECANENKGSNELMTFSQAVEYAVASVTERLNGLKIHDVKLFTVYDSTTNQLKSVIEKNRLELVLRFS